MKHARVEPALSTSDMDSADRIKRLLQELWDARQAAVENHQAPRLERHWWELEEVVTHALDQMGKEEELAL